MEFALEKHVFCHQYDQKSRFTHAYRRDNVQNTWILAMVLVKLANPMVLLSIWSRTYILEIKNHKTTKYIATLGPIILIGRISSDPPTTCGAPWVT